MEQSLVAVVYTLPYIHFMYHRDFFRKKQLRNDGYHVQQNYVTHFNCVQFFYREGILDEENKRENPSLSAEIRVLVQNYKQLSENDRRMIVGIMQLYKNQKRKV